MLRRLTRRLRSPRVAVGLIVAVLVYAAASTVVPRGAAGSPDVAQWAVRHPFGEVVARAFGMHAGFSSAVFLTLATFLALSTALCSWERTERARRLTSGSQDLTSAEAERLRARPDAAIPLGELADPAEARSLAEAALTAEGLRVRSGPRLVEGVAAAWGAWGSPVFHWSLTLLMVTLALGQATRAEGWVGLPLGETVRDALASYIEIARGPLFADRFTGLSLRADELLADYRTGTVSRGPVPLVTVLRGTSPLTSQLVYANNPLRLGALTVHMTGTGLVAALSVESTSGQLVRRDPFMLQYGSYGATTSVPVEYTMLSEAGEPLMDLRIRVPVPLGRDGLPVAQVPTSPVSIIETAAAGTGRYGRPVTLELGQATPLPRGQYLRFVGADDWVKVTVVNDWSVPFIYGLMVLAWVGMGVSMFVAPRRVLVGIVDGDEGLSLHVTVWHARRDPVFRRRVIAALEPPVAPLPASSAEAARR